MEKIGIQGGEASYSEIATHKLHQLPELAYHETFEDVFTALRNRQIGVAVVAIANNRLGFIPEPFEELTRGPGGLYITGETYLPVKHSLMSVHGATLEGITEVHSQTPALDQCRKFLEHILPKAKIVEQHDTAGSAKMVSEWGDPSKAAIASTKAAEKYSLSIIREEVQDDTTNITRFVELRLTNGHEVTDADKTTMILKTPEGTGALLRVLVPFARENINLRDLHSKFIPNSAFDMDFFVEFDAGAQEERTKKVLQELQENGNTYTILGSYKRAEIPLDEV